MKEWLKVKDFAEIESVSERAARLRKDRGQIKMYRYVDGTYGGGKSGKELEIHYSELSEKGKLHYFSEIACNHTEPQAVSQVAATATTLSEEEIEMEVYSSASEWARKKADKYLPIIKATQGMKGAELMEYIRAWNHKHPDFKTSYQRTVDARNKYREQGIAGLLAQYGKSAGKTAVKDEWFEYFKEAYFTEGAPSLKSCWIRTLGYAKHIEPKINPENFPSPMSFLRRLEREIPEEAIFMARHGREAWNRKYGNYIERDYSNVRAGQCGVSDHAQVDVAVVNPKTGKPCFPWITAWRCFKSGKWLGWLHHPEPPNSDHVFQSFYYAISECGLFEDVYIDNGKDYRCRDFAGGRQYHKLTIDTGKATSMLALLGVTPHFSLPYNAQSKTIERDFLKNKEWFSKHMPGYRGGHVKERPEKLKAEIKAGRIMQWDEYARLMDDFIVNVLNKMSSQGKVLQGMCPDELWDKEIGEIRRVSKDALKLFCMRSSKVLTIGRNGVLDSEIGMRYWAEWMSGMKGTKVYIRRDIKAYQEAWVFRAEDDEYLGKAVLGEMSAPALAKTDIEKARVKEALAIKKRNEKMAKAYIENKDTLTVSDSITHMAAGTKELNKLRGYEPEKRKEVNVIRIANTAMDKVAMKDKQMQKEGVYDLSLIQPPARKKKIALFECELDDVAEGGL